MDTFMGIDPAMANVGWVLLKKRRDGRFQYMYSGVLKHRIRGTGKWDKKIGVQVEKAKELVERYAPDCIYIETPTWGSWGKNSVGVMVKLMTTMDLAWRIAFEIKGMIPNLSVITLKPDRQSKDHRARMVMGVVANWPVGASDHESDSAYLILRRA